MTTLIPKIPEFLDRRKNPMVMLDTHQHAILSMTHEQALVVWEKMQKRVPGFKPKKKNDVGNPKALLRELLLKNANQADVIVSLIRETSTPATEAMEKMMGKPISRYAEKTKSTQANGATSHGRKRAGKQPAWSETDKIKLLVENPKKKGCDPWKRFNLYVEDMTVGAALKAGVFPADIDWDLKHKFIKLEQ